VTSPNRTTRGRRRIMFGPRARTQRGGHRGRATSTNACTGGFTRIHATTGSLSRCLAVDRRNDSAVKNSHRQERARLACDRRLRWRVLLVSGRVGADMMLAAPRMLVAASLRPAARLLPARAATLAPIQSSVACACSSDLDGGGEGEGEAHSVYACPVCQQPFRRWRNAMRHFKARTRGCSPRPSYARRADRRRSTGRCRRRGSALRNV